MPDKQIVCANCGRSFLWSEGEQRFYKERHLSPPKRCKACRTDSRATGTSPKRSTTAPRASAKRVSRRANKQRQPRTNLYRRYSMIGFGTAVALTALLWFGRFTASGVTAWLIAINVTTILLFGYDKAIAKGRRQRVPERVLLLLALSFGAIGALVGMTLFRHKTAKAMFQIKFWLVVVIQVLLVWAYFAIGGGIFTI